MIAIALLVVFFAFAGLMYARKLPAIVAVPLMALALALTAGVPLAHLGTIVVAGTAKLAVVYVAVIFGALLGRVTMDTGIARAIVNLAAEYGGERPFALTMLLCAVVALLFTSLSGLGAIIMVGSIVLPIMLTAGVPRTIAATLFLMSFALGFIFNIANWTFYSNFFGVAPSQFIGYAMVLAAIDGVALAIYAAIAFRRERGYATWAVRLEGPPPKGVPAIALLTPLVPLLLYYALHVAATPAFALAAVFGALVTQPRRAVDVLVAAAIRGFEDVAAAVVLFMGIGMLLVAAAQPELAAALRPLGGGWIANPVAYVLVFGLCSPLALYRGPLNPFGVGIVIFTVLLAAHAVPPVVLVAAIMAVVQVQNVCDPTNTQNVWVATFTGVPIDAITKRTLPFQVAVATLATVVVVLAAPQLLHTTALLPGPRPARAAESVPMGMFAPPAAAGRIGVGDDGTPLGRVAADAVAGALRGAAMQAFRLDADPDADDCAHKPYAAYVQVTTSTFALIEGTDLDVGLRLEDCGGWIVDEWHDHRVVPAADAAVARRLARAGVARLLQWARSEPVRSGNLFAHGLAARPGGKPSYYYALFKTVDGYMRAYVRAGGPAYAAGMRTDDIVNKLDGKFWWEYGTYQTEARAYDGKPHRFEIQRGSRTIEIRLEAPFVMDATEG